MLQIAHAPLVGFLLQQRAAPLATVVSVGQVPGIQECSTSAGLWSSASSVVLDGADVFKARRTGQITGRREAALVMYIPLDAPRSELALVLAHPALRPQLHHRRDESRSTTAGCTPAADPGVRSGGYGARTGAVERRPMGVAVPLLHVRSADALRFGRSGECPVQDGSAVGGDAMIRPIDAD